MEDLLLNHKNCSSFKVYAETQLRDIVFEKRFKYDSFLSSGKIVIIMNLPAVTVLIICINTYGVLMFNLKTFPDLAGNAAKVKGDSVQSGTSSNVTLVCHHVTTAIVNLTSS